MADFVKVLAILVLTAIGVLSFVLLVLAIGGFAILILLALLAAYAWMLYAFLHYRYCRREELLQVIANAAESGVPLAPALRAYLQDRPQGNLREFWTATILCIFPVPGFYWIWYRRYNFDRKVAELARHLECGVPLFHALQFSPALASRETVLAAAIGESTGRLPQCLRSVAQQRRSTMWVEMIPQMVYPFAILLIISFIIGFLTYFIAPKFKKIFLDFGVEIPTASRFLFQTDLVVEYGIFLLVVAQIVFLTTAVLAFSSTARWFFPGLGAVYRRQVQSRVLQTLSLMLETGRPIPESLAVLASLPIGGMAARRLIRARCRIEQGEPFGESLQGVGLLSAAMLPLVHTAERSGNLPWALAEMAQALHQRIRRTVERVLQVVFPLTVIALGILVGFIVIAIFLPVIKLITELSQ